MHPCESTRVSDCRRKSDDTGSHARDVRGQSLHRKQYRAEDAAEQSRSDTSSTSLLCRPLLSCTAADAADLMNTAHSRAQACGFGGG
jgi:hypothetical protein